MASDQPVAKFAARRPDWELPQLQLEQLQLHPFDVLEQATSRQPCPKCHKSRFLYCYDCAVAFTALPSVQLPFQLSIISHHAELASKNTGVMAAILCPEQVQLHSIDQMPACDPARCAVMFPCDDALLPDQLDLQQLQRIVILDSKWAKAKELNEHPALHGMQRVKLPGSPKSCFWRFHTSGVTDEGVCTIEALHLLLSAVAERLPDPAQRDPHCFDNLLWYFAFQHQLVAKKAAERQQKKMQQSQEQQDGQQQPGSGSSQQQQPRYPQQQGNRSRQRQGDGQGKQQQKQQQQQQQRKYPEQKPKQSQQQLLEGRQQAQQQQQLHHQQQQPLSMREVEQPHEQQGAAAAQPGMLLHGGQQQQHEHQQQPEQDPAQDEQHGKRRKLDQQQQQRL